MRRVLLGALFGSLTLPAAFAFDDESIHDFFVQNAANSADELKEIEAELILEMKEVKDARSKRGTADDPQKQKVQELKDQLAAKQHELTLAQYFQTTVRGRLSSERDWESRNGADAIKNMDEKIKVLDVATLELAEDKPTSIDDKVMAIAPDMPFQIVQHLNVEKKGENEHSLEVSYSFKVDESIPRDKWPLGLRTRVAKMDDATAKKFLEDQLSPALNAASYKVGKVEELKTDEAKRAAVLKDLPRKLAAHNIKEVFGRSSENGMNAYLSGRISEIGGPRDRLSEVWELEQEISRESSSPAASGNRMEELDLKYDLIQAVRKDPALLDEAEPCDAIIKAVGRQRVEKNLRAGRRGNSGLMECESFFQKKEVVKEVEKKEVEAKQEDQSQQLQQAKMYNDQMLALAASCIARGAQLAQQSAIRPIDNMIRPLYNALASRGAGCTYYGQMMSSMAPEAVSAGSGDPFSSQLFGNNPFLLEAAADETQYKDKARDVVKRNALGNTNSNDELLKQRECLAKMNSLAGMSLQHISMFGPGGQFSPQDMQDPTIRQMMKFNAASTALLAAISEELAERSQGGMGGMQAMGGNSNTGMNSAPALQNGGIRTPVRIRTTDSTQLERGQRGLAAPGNGNSIRRDSGAAIRTNGSRPLPPAYLGD